MLQVNNNGDLDNVLFSIDGVNKLIKKFYVKEENVDPVKIWETKIPFLINIIDGPEDPIIYVSHEATVLFTDGTSQILLADTETTFTAITSAYTIYSEKEITTIRFASDAFKEIKMSKMEHVTTLKNSFGSNGMFGPSLSSLEKLEINSTSALTSIEDWGIGTTNQDLDFYIETTSNVENFSEAFANATWLVTFPDLDYSNGITFYHTWENTSITRIPDLDLPNAQIFRGAFSYNDLLSFVGVITLTNVTDFSFVFTGCGALGYIPRIEIPNNQTLEETWRDCISLIQCVLPDTSNVLTISMAWNGCTTLGKIAPLALPLCSNIRSAFEDTMITECPITELKPTGDIIMGAAYKNSKIQSFPTVLEGRTLTAVDGLFVDCTDLVSIGSFICNVEGTFHGGPLFSECSSLEYVGNIEWLGTSIGNLRLFEMFMNCTNLKCIESLTATAKDENASNKADCFTGCSSLIAPDSTEQADILAAVGFNYTNLNPCPTT